MDLYSLDRLMAETRRLAAQYRRSTGKTLPVSAELAVHDAVRLLGLAPAPPEAVGYDALWRRPDAELRVQVKGRVVFDEDRGGQRIGQVRQERAWDCLALVIMDEHYETVEIYMALREDVLAAAGEASEPRKRRGAISLARFRVIGERVWTRDGGAELAGCWPGLGSA